MKRHPEAGYDSTTPHRRWSRPTGGRSRLDRRRDSAPASFEADVVEHALVLPPLGPDANVQVEKHLCVEELLEILARRDADAFDHLAATAHDDRLLRLALDDDGAVQ